jgi:hypothetical protein
MKRYEFEHVRMIHGVEGDLSKKHREEKIKNILTERKVSRNSKFSL